MEGSKSLLPPVMFFDKLTPSTANISSQLILSTESKNVRCHTRGIGRHEHMLT